MKLFRSFKSLFNPRFERLDERFRTGRLPGDRTVKRQQCKMATTISLVYWQQTSICKKATSI